VEIDDYLGYLDTLAAAVFRTVERGKVRLVLLGFSQGVATATRWAARAAARRAPAAEARGADRLVLWGGDLPPDLELTRDVFAGADLTLVVGTADQYITPKVVAAAEARLAAASIPHRVLRFEGGHALDAGVLKTLS